MVEHYTRTTHNFNNETREWEPRKELRKKIDEEWALNSLLKSPVGIHALDSGRWQTLWVIVDENKKYAEQYPEDFRDYNMDNLEDDVKHDLEILIKHGWVARRSDLVAKHLDNTHDRAEDEDTPCDANIWPVLVDKEKVKYEYWQDNQIVERLNEAFAKIEANRSEKEYIKIHPELLKFVKEELGFDFPTEAIRAYMKVLENA